MNSTEIQEAVFEWALNKNFNAPYGVLMSEQTNSKGRKFKEVAFGRKRTLDAAVQIYNRNFMILKVNSAFDGQVFKSYNELMEALETL